MAGKLVFARSRCAFVFSPSFADNAGFAPPPLTPRERRPMSIKSDKWIRRMAVDGMIEPF